MKTQPFPPSLKQKFHISSLENVHFSTEFPTRISWWAFCFHLPSALLILSVKNCPVDGSLMWFDSFGCALIKSKFAVASLHILCNRFVSLRSSLVAVVYTFNRMANRQNSSPKIWFRCGHDRLVGRKNFPIEVFSSNGNCNFGNLDVK